MVHPLLPPVIDTWPESSHPLPWYRRTQASILNYVWCIFDHLSALQYLWDAPQSSIFRETSGILSDLYLLEICEDMGWAACFGGASESFHIVFHNIARDKNQQWFFCSVSPKKKKGCQKQRTFGVRLLSSSSAETCLSGLAGPAAAFSLFFSSLARCFCLFLSSLLLKELSIDAGNQWVV